MQLRADQITIAITVFNRRDFVHEAIRSALNQTVPVKVIVVDNCSPDEQMGDYILHAFGGQVEFYRNSRNRGMFDNWNACMEYCQTPWLSILHDDDLLHPHSIETMIRLVKAAPNRGLYFGEATSLTNEEIKSHRVPPVSGLDSWSEIDIPRLANECFLKFPGQLFRVAAAQELGGFNPNSYGPGDWDMWFRLALRFGAAVTVTEVAINRTYYQLGRGTSRLERMGWKWALDNAQRKRNLNRLRKEKDLNILFDRTALLKKSPVPSRLLIRFSPLFSRRLLAYNAWLFTHSQPPHFGYAFLQWLVRLFGPKVLLAVAFLRRRKN
jgi:glycosyltransferase involved in cell wall biosynthesis